MKKQDFQRSSEASEETKKNYRISTRRLNQMNSLDSKSECMKFVEIFPQIYLDLLYKYEDTKDIGKINTALGIKAIKKTDFTNQMQ